MGIWNSELKKYFLKIHLENGVDVICVIEGYTIENALESACYRPILFMGCSTFDIATMYVTTSGEELSQKDFQTVVFKVRDGKLNYEIKEIN